MAMKKTKTMKTKMGLSFVLICMLTTPLTTPITYGATFNDLNAYKWAEPSIQNMVINDFVGGFSDGTFRPAAKITRAELVAIINKMNGFTTEAPIYFSDVKQTHWAYQAIQIAIHEGYVSGLTNSTFGPNEYVTREQIATIVNNLYHLENKTLSSPIKDLSKTSTWAVQAMVNVMANKLMTGFPDGTFGGKQYLSRAEAVVVLNKIVTTDIPTKEKWEVSNIENVPPVKPTTPTIPTTPTTPTVPTTPSNPGTSNPSVETLSKLRTVVSRLQSDSIPEMTTNTQRSTANIIVASISKYLLDQSYSTALDVLEAKGLVAQMSNSEYQAFKNAITTNILLSDLTALNDTFQLIDQD